MTCKQSRKCTLHCISTLSNEEIFILFFKMEIMEEVLILRDNLSRTPSHLSLTADPYIMRD